MSKRKKIRERRKEKEERYDRVACADTDASRAAGGRRQDTCMERQRERERETRGSCYVGREPCMHHAANALLSS